MRLVCGVGINDADYVVEKKINGKRNACPIYLSWRRMLERCYSIKFKIRRPTYTGCSVSEEWLTFSNFSNWMKSQDWQGMHLDKDILIDNNKVYSSVNCCFVSPKTNTLLGSCLASRGKYLIGCSWHKPSKKFAAYVSINCIRVHLGSFNTEIEAHNEWRKAKAAEIIKSAFTQTQDNVREALLERARVLLDSDK